MKTKTFLLCRIKRLALAVRPISTASRPPLGCPVRPKRNRATPMAVDKPPLHARMDVDDPGLHLEMMDLDPGWVSSADPTLQEAAAARPCAMDWELEQKGSPPPVPVQPAKVVPSLTCETNRRKLQPLRSRRKAVANLPSSFKFTLPAATVGAAGSSSRGADSKSSSSQQRVASQPSPPTASVKVESRKRKVRSDEFRTQEAAPSPFGSSRPKELVPPAKEGLTQIDRELLSLLGEIESVPTQTAAEHLPTQVGQQLGDIESWVNQLKLDDLENWITQLKPKEKVRSLDEKLAQIEYLEDVLRQASLEEEDPVSAGP